MLKIAGLIKFPRIVLERLPKNFIQPRALSCTRKLLYDLKGKEIASQPLKHLTRPSDQPSPPGTDPLEKNKKKKTVAEADEELRERLEQMSGGGGASGIEYEDGKPQTMKRSVRNNMFRYI